MAWTRLLTVVAMLAVLALPFVPDWAATEVAGGAVVADSLSNDLLADDVGDDPAAESTEALAPALVLNLCHGWSGPMERLVGCHGAAVEVGPVAPPPRGLRTA